MALHCWEGKEIDLRNDHQYWCDQLALRRCYWISAELYVCCVVLTLCQHSSMMSYRVGGQPWGCCILNPCSTWCRTWTMEVRVWSLDQRWRHDNSSVLTEVTLYKSGIF